MQVSEKFRAAVKLAPTPAYKLAWAGGVNPTTLSKLINGIEKPKANDVRVTEIGKLLGLSPDECFE
jgi:hypothetical protein